MKRSLAGDMLQSGSAVSGADFDLLDIFPDGQATLHNEPITVDHLERSAPLFFEALAAALWKRQGYQCHLTPQSDAGVDVVGLRGSEGVLIQCKTTSKSDRKLGWEAVKEVVGGTAIYLEQYPTTMFKRICLTNQRFNESAHERARANDVQLIEQTALIGLINEHPLGTLDVLRC